MTQNYIERYWRDARLEDAIKRPPMVARFRDNNDDQWIEDFLCGVDTENNFWFSKGDIPHVFWKFCQVYDAPDPGEGWRLVDIDIAKRVPSDERWYPAIGKWLSPDDCYCERYQIGCFYRRRITPDPGEGWRLIDPANEKWQEGDEIYVQSTGTWRKRLTPFQDWALSINRRRITPAVTYVPFTWEDREQLRGRWIKESDNVEIQVTAFHCDSKGVFYSEGRSAKVLVERWRFLDTGKPVGKEVTQ